MYIYTTFKPKEEVNLSDAIATGEIPTILLMAGNSGTNEVVPLTSNSPTLSSFNQPRVAYRTR